MMTAKASKTMDAEGSSAKAEYLCYCSRVYADEFFDAASTADAPDFNALCMRTGVGIHCTACVLDAERVFHKALRGKTEAIQGEGSVQAGEAASARSSLWKRLARLVPSVANSYRSLAPIFGGRGISTVLSINNFSLSSLDAKLVPVRAQIDWIAPDGSRIKRSYFTVRPDAKLEIEMNRAFNASDAPLALLGSARIRLRARGIGHVGIIRPHFRVESSVAAAVVHSVDSGDTDSFHYFSGTPEASSLVVVVSGDKATSRHCLTLRRLDGSPVLEQRGELAGFGSAMYTLPTEGSESFSVHVSSSRIQRSFFVVRDHDTISIDHI